MTNAKNTLMFVFTIVLSGALYTLDDTFERLIAGLNQNKLSADTKNLINEDTKQIQIRSLIKKIIEQDFQAIVNLTERGVNLSQKDAQGKTPLHYAVRNSSPNSLIITNWFIDHGIPITAKDNSGKTPFDEALQAENIPHLKTLIAATSSCEAIKNCLQPDISFLVLDTTLSRLPENKVACKIENVDTRGFFDVKTCNNEKIGHQIWNLAWTFLHSLNIPLWFVCHNYDLRKYHVICNLEYFFSFSYHNHAEDIFSLSRNPFFQKITRESTKKNIFNLSDFQGIIVATNKISRSQVSSFNKHFPGFLFPNASIKRTDILAKLADESISEAPYFNQLLQTRENCTLRLFCLCTYEGGNVHSRLVYALILEETEHKKVEEPEMLMNLQNALQNMLNDFYWATLLIAQSDNF